MDRDREHGRGPHRPHGDAAARWQGARGGRRQRGFAAAELYEPGTGRWTATGSWSRPRSVIPRRCCPMARCSSRAVAMQRTRAANWPPPSCTTRTAGHWTATGSMGMARIFHTATLLADGTVLVVDDGLYDRPASAELYDPASGRWTETASPAAARSDTRRRCCSTAGCSHGRLQRQQPRRRTVRPRSRELTGASWFAKWPASLTLWAVSRWIDGWPPGTGAPGVAGSTLRRVWAAYAVSETRWAHLASAGRYSVVRGRHRRLSQAVYPTLDVS